ncbi:MAG: hypothetical protein M3R30_04715 [Candidatus Eremiobacteraeota bacterium]|nr:hypothetical protein [Candidatus Eremiobacteraeota bacterium]
MMIAAIALATHLRIAPWKGADPVSAIVGATKYRLTVSGRPGAHVHLRATGRSEGWVAAFCTDRICSPDQTVLDLPASGRVDVQFELVRDDEHAAATSGRVTIRTDQGAKVTAHAP